MKILSALLDAALLPLSIAVDILLPPFVTGNSKSDTRKRIEKIEDELGL